MTCCTDALADPSIPSAECCGFYACLSDMQLKLCSMIADHMRNVSVHIKVPASVLSQGSLGGVRVLAALGGRLFGGLFRRADAIAAAMTARGFAGGRVLRPRPGFSS